MKRPLLFLTYILLFFVLATSYADQGLVALKIVQSPLELKLNVYKINGSLYRIEGSVLNKGTENIYNSEAKLTVSPQQYAELNKTIQKLGVLRPERVKTFSFKARVLQPDSYLAEVIVRGHDKSGNTEHVMGATTTFVAENWQSSLIRWILKWI